jgi:cytochrome c-type biogenesis protein CcsB
LSYGIALVCFAVAVIYLLKDKVKIEAMAIWSSIFAISVIGTVSKFSVFTEFVYRAGLFVENEAGKKPFSAPFRLEIPFAGPALAIAGILLFGAVVSFLFYIYQKNEGARTIGHYFLKLALIAQIVSLGLLVYGVKTTTDVYPKLEQQLAADPGQYTIAGMAIAENQQMSIQELSQLRPAQYDQMGRNYAQATQDKLFLSLNTNPVEIAALLTGLVGTLFVIFFGFKTERLQERLPSLELLDNLMYKTACLAFAGLAMLLITGAIWANESWGRPWGFDSKETGALVAWLTYAAFLHTRISRGWKGRSSAYFAIVGFLLVIFTYLGVSYLLKGLHSYA